MVLATFAKNRLWLQLSDDWRVFGLGIWSRTDGIGMYLGPFLISWSYIGESSE